MYYVLLCILNSDIATFRPSMKQIQVVKLHTYTKIKMNDVRSENKQHLNKTFFNIRVKKNVTFLK